MHEPWWITISKAFIVINVVMVFFALTTWLERKLLGRMQLRYGPNRAGPKGLLVPIADLLKLIRKEAFAPIGAKAAALHHRAGHLDVHGAARVQRAAVGRGLDGLGLPHQRRGRERPDLADPDLRARLARHLRLHHRRLGVRVEVLDPRLDAHVRAARLVRGLARAVACSASC